MLGLEAFPDNRSGSSAGAADADGRNDEVVGEAEFGLVKLVEVLKVVVVDNSGSVGRVATSSRLCCSTRLLRCG